MAAQLVAVAIAVLSLTTSWPVGAFSAPVALVSFVLLAGTSISLVVIFGGIFWSSGTPQLIVIARHIARSKSVFDIGQLILLLGSIGALIWLVVSGWAGASISLSGSQYVVQLGRDLSIHIAMNQLWFATFAVHVLPYALAAFAACALGLLLIHSTKSLTKEEFETLSRAFGTGRGNIDDPSAGAQGDRSN